VLFVLLRYKVDVYKAGEKFEDTRRGNQKQQIEEGQKI
jgi:hypothetical protein